MFLWNLHYSSLEVESFEDLSVDLDQTESLDMHSMVPCKIVHSVFEWVDFQLHLLIELLVAPPVRSRVKLQLEKNQPFPTNEIEKKYFFVILTCSKGKPSQAEQEQHFAQPKLHAAMIETMHKTEQNLIL